MRTTKLIKEYVEKRVREVHPMTAEELAWVELRDKVRNARKKADEIIKEYAEKVVAELNAENGFEDEFCLKISEYGSIVTESPCGNSKIYKAYDKANDERGKKIDEKIEEILINLELGGTRKDLDEMLANIGK